MLVTWDIYFYPILYLPSVSTYTTNNGTGVTGAHVGGSGGGFSTFQASTTDTGASLGTSGVLIAAHSFPRPF